MTAKTNRTAMGIGAMICVFILFDLGPVSEIPDTFNAIGITFYMPRIDNFVALLFASAVASLVARRGFMIPAIALVTILWAVAIYILYQIALPAGPASFPAIAVSNIPGLLASIAAASLGVVLGEHYYRSEFQSGTAAS